MTATAKGHWPVILGPVSEVVTFGSVADFRNRFGHFRVISGPVGEVTQCMSIRDFSERVPNADQELASSVESFFATASGPATLEIVPAHP